MPVLLAGFLDQKSKLTHNRPLGFMKLISSPPKQLSSVVALSLLVSETYLLTITIFSFQGSKVFCIVRIHFFSHSNKWILFVTRLPSAGGDFPRLFVLPSTGMDIITLGNDLLRQKAEIIKPIGSEYAKIADDMIELLHIGKGVGLAGPQIGLPKRIFVVHIEGEDPRVFINPSIIETSQNVVKYEEGCLSIPGVWADVERPQAVRVQAWNAKGRPFTLDAEGILARVIQHEYDHLEGVLFIDRLTELKRKKVIAKYEKRKADKDKLRKAGVNETAGTAEG
jgi:peptide deformylase